MAGFLSKLRSTYAIFCRLLPGKEDLADIETAKFHYSEPSHREFDDFRYRLYGDDVVLDPFHNTRVVVHRDSSLSSVGRYAESLLSFGDELVLGGISLESPGWMDIIGRLNPLHFIVDLLILIRDWGNKKQRDGFENDILRTEAIQRRIQLLQLAGFHEREIRAALRNWLWNPVASIEAEVATGAIIGQRINQLNPPKDASASSSPPPS